MVMVSLIWTCVGVPDLSAAQKDEANLLAKARLEVAIKGFESAETVDEMCIWSERILVSELSLCQSIDERIAALEKQLKRAEKLETMAIDGFKHENYTLKELMEAKFFRLDTQCRLAEEKANKSLIAK
jgi:uncharacterized membrane-anchored protein